MKSLLLLAAFSTSLEAQTTTNLGFIGPNKAIALVPKETNVNYYSIELLQGGTNTFNFYVTNNYILPSDLEFVKPGHLVMGIKSIHSEGVESKVSVFTFYKLEGNIEGPDAYVVGISFTNIINNLTQAVEVIKTRRVIPESPDPRGIVFEVTKENNHFTVTNSILVRSLPYPLDKSTNETFGTNYINSTKRRNE